MRSVNLRWVNMRACNFVVSGPIFTNFFRPTWDVFLIFDISIRFGDIRDRRLKLSEIAFNFGRFWRLKF